MLKLKRQIHGDFRSSLSGIALMVVSIISFIAFLWIVISAVRLIAGLANLVS